MPSTQEAHPGNDSDYRSAPKKTEATFSPPETEKLVIKLA